MNWKKIDKKKVLVPLGLLLIGGVLFFMVPNTENEKQYFHHQGNVFGTYYSIIYAADSSMEKDIQQAFEAFDASLSMFNPQSTISRINRNEAVKTDSYFEAMYTESRKISDLSHGSFDITVAPLVNLWGFGFTDRTAVDVIQIDSVKQYVGYQKIELKDHRIIKQDSAIMLDASAIAKGYACDVIAKLLAEAGCSNYLVEIGGEVVAKGVNSQGKKWSIGISKPIDDKTGSSTELQDTIYTNNLCMATSGNYRNFYYEGNEKRSHTIDPKTGFPVMHQVLSATVVAGSCMRADALATACMVMGEEEAIKMIEQTEDAACFLIIGDPLEMKTRVSKNWISLVDPQ